MQSVTQKMDIFHFIFLAALLWVELGPPKSHVERLVQDGGVEGRALIPSCESTGITTNC